MGYREGERFFPTLPRSQSPLLSGPWGGSWLSQFPSRRSDQPSRGFWSTRCILVSALLRADGLQPTAPCSGRRVAGGRSSPPPWPSDSRDPSLQRLLAASRAMCITPSHHGLCPLSMFLETDATLLAKMWSTGQSIPWESAGNAESLVHTAPARSELH